MTEKKFRKDTLQVLKTMSGKPPVFATKDLVEAGRQVHASHDKAKLGRDLVIAALRFLKVKNIVGAAQIMTLAVYALGSEAVSDLLERVSPGAAKKLIKEDHDSRHAHKTMSPQRAPKGVSLRGGSKKR